MLYLSRRLKMEKDSVLLSVKPAYAELICEGVKTVELRRKFSEKSLNKRCYIYSSSPTQKVIGECYIHSVEKLPVLEIWKKYSANSMISWNDFKNYFDGLEYGYAVKVSKHIRYDKPISLKSKLSLERPPQSYCFV